MSYSNGQGWTPLHSATRFGHIVIIPLSLERGAEWSAVTRDGRFALQDAAWKGHSELVQQLLKNGADAMARDSSGQSALFYAIMSGLNKVFSMLLNHAPALNEVRDHSGSTALSVASRLGKFNMVEMLVSLPNTNLAFRDSLGRTALWWAQTQEHDSIAECIIRSAEVAGVSASPLGLPIGSRNFLIRNGNYCMICKGNIEFRSAFYLCRIFYDGRFLICSDCKRLRAHSTFKSHVLVPF
ncbi:hypothetical protein PFICI_08345 [Pestalotiopsis fici W106-1]|uniref:Uncharacterized protein n=1 Tax=Pestalotiopsis fici (strain W106-1 / CGMCC3.15140) TaxID=1229662 RepID=W3X6L4_PESFW|nr:uncharacterized protein PFICI_08345 [Pestalotiopsis fici W106-1]ETS80816.1 hypothetical protein PFICI_08345 [Pestalotiopsis fici W106-1]